MGFEQPSDEILRARLASARRIAVVGLSTNPARASLGVSRFLLRHGYTIVPVTPLYPEVLGMASVADLAALDGPVDIVDVFRNSDAIPALVDEFLALPGDPVLWLQENIWNEPAAERARAAGRIVVMDRCILKELQRLDVPAVDAVA